jgi:hypothetical protein
MKLLIDYAISMANSRNKNQILRLDKKTYQEFKLEVKRVNNDNNNNEIKTYRDLDIRIDDHDNKMIIEIE